MVKHLEISKYKKTRLFLGGKKSQREKGEHLHRSLIKAGGMAEGSLEAVTA